MNTTNNESERGRLITRYSLTTSPLYQPVHAYLAPLSLPPSSAEMEDKAHDTFENLKTSVTHRMEKDAGLQEALRKIAGLPLGNVSDVYLAAFEDVRQPDSDFTRTYVSVLYARALQHLGRDVERDKSTFLATAQRLFEDSRGTLSGTLSYLESLHPDFVGHLVLEAEARRGENPFFRARLERAAELFDRYGDGASGWLGAKDQPPTVMGVDNLQSSAALPAHMAMAMTLHA
ncbi:hypothetical protein ACIGJO_05675 [Streptomyces sp. NPDC079020]|uniref:hypothetical protein n=1 Tax=Streptomyces sp. NPDC079020 TaxID=3365722 RepID=UPI0037CEEF44